MRLIVSVVVAIGFTAATGCATGQHVPPAPAALPPTQVRIPPLAQGAYVARWEYLCITAPTQEQMMEAGEQGWELVTAVDDIVVGYVASRDGATIKPFTYCFKRPRPSPIASPRSWQDLPGADLPPEPPPIGTPPSEPVVIEDEALDLGITKIDDTTYEIDRSLFDRLVANPFAVGRGARVVPSMKDGQPNGLKFYAIRPNSVYARLGLSNGDRLERINQHAIRSIDDVGPAAEELMQRKPSTVEIGLVRRGQPLVLRYRFRNR